MLLLYSVGCPFSVSEILLKRTERSLSARLRRLLKVKSLPSIELDPRAAQFIAELLMKAVKPVIEDVIDRPRLISIPNGRPVLVGASS